MDASSVALCRQHRFVLMQVAATTLDDVWFPLIKKKGLNKKPVAAQASMSSDLSARYKIIPRSNQVSQAVEVSASALVCS